MYKLNNLVVECNLFLFSIMLSLPNEVDTLAEIYYLTHKTTKNWRKLLKFGETLDLETKRKLLWLWPKENNLWQINKLLKDCSITNLLSIGCGNGLFEWVLKEALDLQVYGLEVDRQWWLSNYAIKSFIPLNFLEDMKESCVSGSFLQQCCVLNDWNFALMFCYFNNRLAFLEYLRVYQGNYVIILGPFEKSDIYTDPLPLEPNFPEDLNVKWIFKKTVYLENNILVLYEKCYKIKQ